MNRLMIICFVMSPVFANAEPVKDVNVVSMPPVAIEGDVTLDPGAIPLPVTPELIRTPYLSSNTDSVTSALGTIHCVAELAAPSDLVIETVSFRSDTAALTLPIEDLPDFEDEVRLQVTTSGQVGEFHFPTAHKKTIWREPVSPAAWSTQYQNTMSLRLYPDVGTSVTLSVNLLDMSGTLPPSTPATCSLWVSGYTVDPANTSGLGP